MSKGIDVLAHCVLLVISHEHESDIGIHRQVTVVINQPKPNIRIMRVGKLLKPR